MTQPRPDWSQDPQLKHWRRGRVELPFTTRERSETETQIRILATAGLTGLTICVATFAVLVGFGMFPDIWLDPRVTEAGDPMAGVWITLGSGVAGAGAILLFLSPILVGSLEGTGHPWTFDATEEGFTITNRRGEAASGPWSAWTLGGYDTMTIPKGGAVIAVLRLSLNGVEHPVRLMGVMAQRRFMRIVAQKIAV